MCIECVDVFLKDLHYDQGLRTKAAQIQRENVKFKLFKVSYENKNN